jgi:hypothetical protein
MKFFILQHTHPIPPTEMPIQPTPEPEIPIMPIPEEMPASILSV